MAEKDTNNGNVLYHFSKVKGLKEIKPRMSYTYHKEWVFATPIRDLGLLFASGMTHGDYDADYGYDKGKVFFYEGYKDALKECFKGISGSCYTVPADSFKRNQTNFGAELVSEVAVPVLKEEIIPDLYVEIMKAIEAGRFEIHYYDEKNVEFNQHFRDKVYKMTKANKLVDFPDSPLYQFVMNKFPDVLEQLIAEKNALTNN